MDNIDDLILSLTGKKAEEERRQQEHASRNSRRSTKVLSDSEDEGNGYSDEDDAVNDDDEDMENIDEYGPDLYKDEEDRKRLQALPEVERERILAERSEERQRNLERLEVRKLLKDGRREDATRRSTRSKGSGTASALSELARRREEKNKSKSKRHRKETPSPERKRVRRYGDQSDYEHSDDEYNESEDESEKKAKKRAPSFEELQTICITRNILEKWLFAPFFENTIIGCFVRIFIGPDPQKKTPVYRLCEIIDVVPWHKSYKVTENTWSNKALKIKHGKAEKDFTMDIISNQPITQHEYSRLLATLESDRVRIPSLDQVERKAEDLKQAREYVLNDHEVNEMIEKKRAVKGASVNAAMEKAQLLARLEHAKAYNETEKVLKLTRELKELEERVSSTEGNNQQDVWANINYRNRERDRIEVHEAERRMTEARRKALFESTRAATQKPKENEVAADSSLLPIDTSYKPMVPISTLNKESVNTGQTTSSQTPYEKLVSKVGAEVHVELLAED
ncbi:MAG: hypothetical protein EXX96DRAFT_519096 [Benjaminiella poitrasii]|nr:MAG: hypothetical protein EXX96DRAFT_519096 [Benjaminiella poitrasii]